MNELTPDELANLIQAMSQKQLTPEERAKIPLRQPGSYKKIARVGLSPLFGELPRPLEELTDEDTQDLDQLNAEVEVVFGKTHLSLRELAVLKKGSLLPLEQLCDDLVDIYVNGAKVARGEIVAVDDRFGVKIVSFTKK